MTVSATVVIPTHNGGNRIGALLRSIAADRCDDQVVVVDNGSTDSTRAVLAEYPDVEVISSDRNLGFGAAVNLAARRAEGEALVLLNDDCICDPGFVAAIAASIGGDATMAAGILRDQVNPDLIDTAGMQLDSTLLAFDYLQGEPVSAARSARDPVGPSAAAAAFDRSAFVELGGFDEALFAYWEDVDLVVRMRLGGGTCALARDATGTHAHSATLGSGSREKNALVGYGRGYLLRKWSVLHGRRLLRALLLDSAICLGQIGWDRTVAGISGRIAGYRSATDANTYPAAALIGDEPGVRADLARRWRRRRRLRQRGRRPARQSLEQEEIKRQLAIAGPSESDNGRPFSAELTTPIPDPLRVGGGTGTLLGGRLEAASPSADSLELVANGRPTGERIHLMRLERGSWLWWVNLVVNGDERGDRLELALARRENDNSEVSELGSVQLEPGNGKKPGRRPAGFDEAIEAARAAGGPIVAICLTTCRPAPELFHRQIDSIKAQTHGAWVCLVSDDASPPEELASIEAETASDPRFVVLRNRERLGFFRNYERALEAVPAEAQYVALSDQDDRWRSDKLKLLLDRIGEHALVYGDMRVVTDGGEVLSETYWTSRRNNYTDLTSLLVGNTVTGAAALFRTELLERILPFPPGRGRAYHDHWIALTAIISGGIAYVDEPIQDYVQHSGAAQGHAEANAGAAYLRPRSLARSAWRGLLAVSGLRSDTAWAARYFGMHTRTQLWARVLLARSGEDLDSRRRRVLERVARTDSSPLSLLWLTGRSLRPAWGANEAFGRELILLSSAIWCRSLEARSRLGAGRVGMRKS